MALLKYTGLAHYRELLAEDFAKVGVVVKAGITFAKNEVVTVSDEVAEAIHKLVGDEFTKVEGDFEAEVVRNAEEKTVPDSMPSTDAPVVAETPAEVEQPEATA